MAGLFGRRGGAADGDVPHEWRKALAKVLTRLDTGPVSLSGPAGNYVLTVVRDGLPLSGHGDVVPWIIRAILAGQRQRPSGA